jgi:hypothetical protein
MKRGRPLQRKTPLRSSGLKASGFQLRRTPLKLRSAKRITEDAKRRLLKAELLEAFPICVRCHRGRSIDPHEILRRSQGGSALDETIIVMICRACHDWIHRNPTAARATGWLIHREDLNTEQEDAR